MNLQKLAYISIIILTIYYIGTDIKDRKQLNKSSIFLNKKLTEYNKAQNIFFKDFDKHLNFIKGHEENIQNTTNIFEETKKTLENKPKINFTYKDKK